LLLLLYRSAAAFSFIILSFCIITVSMAAFSFSFLFSQRFIKFAFCRNRW
jgi:hypothetical protein